MTGMSAYKASTRETKEFTLEIMQAGLVPFIKSSPGMGKSAMMQQIANEYNLELIDIRLSTAAPEDLSGLPYFDNGVAKFMPFEMFPLDDTPLPKGKEGWLVFFDEFNSAPKSVQAAAYKPILDHYIGTRRMHERAMIVAAGNLDTDRAITNNIGTALQSRMVHLEMYLKQDKFGQYAEFLEDVAFKYDWDERVISFLSYMPDKLHDFRPDHQDKTFCCPRTWDFMQKLIKGKEYSFIKEGNSEVYSMERKAPMFAGAITSGVAQEFITYTKVYRELPKLADILRDPEKTPVPTDPPLKFAVQAMLVSQLTEDNFQPVSEYLNRMPAEFRVLFFRGMQVRKPQLRAHPAYRRSVVELSRYLHD